MISSIATATLFAATTLGQLTVDDALVTLKWDVKVPAREAGMLVQFNAREGMRVKQGDMLGRIDHTLAMIERDHARIETAIAKSESENAIDLKLAEKSHAVALAELQTSLEANGIVEDSISATEIRRQKLVAEQAELGIEQAKHDLQIARMTKFLKDREQAAAEHHVQRRDILSPMSGTIVETFLQQGEWVRPGEPVVRVVSLERLRVEAFVDGRKHGAELNGCDVELAVAIPPGDREVKFRGKVVFVSPELQPVNGRVRIWAEVENDEQHQLRPGSRGRLTISLPGKR